ncbi:hypothetical protein DPEC_G00254130 [Dallia pectoralis]|uniref:Uncharacterized protein n=1 Tax=Dallia pectoralis TaxID=75939 RepID=A0ACC2FU67_DALPE|nr:hypothetical protein DPEC_G00254130 [Dallia pectoralis]
MKQHGSSKEHSELTETSSPGTFRPMQPGSQKAARTWRRPGEDLQESGGRQERKVSLSDTAGVQLVADTGERSLGSGVTPAWT